ncbi:MAG: MutS-related protein [Betaproteobacteria bacterium]
MRVLLMHRERDFGLQQALAHNADALTQDLGLQALLHAMAGADEFLLDVARKALLAQTFADRDTIQHRQDVLKDCLRNTAVVRDLYELAGQALEGRRRHYYGFLSDYPGAILSGSIGLLETLLEMLRKLRGVAQESAGRFESEGFGTLFSMLARELDDGYLASIEGHLAELKFRRGLLLSARVTADGGAGVDHVLRKPHATEGGWLQRIFHKGPPAYSFRLHERDEAGARIVSDLRNRALNLVANALAQSAEHVLSFFQALRTELGFYVGCLNLHERLTAMELPLCFPEPAPADEPALRFAGLRDPGLALHMQRAPVGNALDARGMRLAIITGPNQGGKSSFLRSVGVAQLMMQCGMFVAAESFRGSVCASLFTHYKREEDRTMKSGKLDEELARMSEIADQLSAGGVMLFNESFAATNDREGSEIARQIVRALLEKRVRVLFVTHLYDFARGLYERGPEQAVFLRAERRPDGTRSFRVVEGEPLETSYGEDVYRAVFADEGDAGSLQERSAPRVYNRRQSC